MTKNQELQKEILAKVKPGVKASDLKKLKRSKSAEDIPASTPNIPLKKSHSQLELPLTNQPSEKEQISQLKEQVKFQAQTSQNYLASLQLSQVKITELEENKLKDQQKNKQLEDQVLQLRLDKIKEFGDYLEKKQALETELEQNIVEGINEIKCLENKLLTTNKKKLELQQKLSQEQLKNTRLELQLINNEDSLPPSANNYWPLLAGAGLLSLVWLLSKNTPSNTY